MSELFELLRLPKNNHWDIDEAWNVLTSSRFFELLKAETASRRRLDVGARPDWKTCHAFLSNWSTIPPEDLRGRDVQASGESPRDVGRRLTVLKKAIRCAEVASRNLDDLTRAIAVLDTKDDELRELSRDAWAWSCIQWLVEPNPAATEVLVALCDETGPTVRGYLARLVIEVYSSGMKQLARHPLDAFEPDPDIEFDGALTDACQSATDLVGEPALSRGVRWRLLHEGRCVRNPTDRSISGAAARAFWFALQNLPPHRKIPDAGVMVLAQMSRSRPGQLDGIGKYVAEKVDAVIDSLAEASIDERIDTIVVASQEDHDAARAKLDARRSDMKPGETPVLRLLN